MKRVMVVLTIAVASAACRLVPVDEAGPVDWSHGALVTPAPGSPAVLYLRLTNPTADSDAVIAVRVTGADSAQLHRTMSMGNGMDEMQPVQALAVPAHDTVRIAPGGFHVMVFGLAASVRAGDSASVTVSFRRAGDMKHWARVITYAQVDSAIQR